MGCDGGSVPKRTEMVRTRKRDPAPNGQAQLAAKWFYCFLSKELLRPPLVACSLGRLYNRESILHFLLNRDAFGEGKQTCKHIRSSKDVVSLNVTVNPEAAAKQQAARQQDTCAEDVLASAVQCPVTGREMNGRHAFVYLKGCGCVFSQQALREMDSDLCFKCAERRSENDVVPLYPERKGENASRKRAVDGNSHQRLARKQTKKRNKYCV